MQNQRLTVKNDHQTLTKPRNWSDKTTAPFSFYEVMNYPIPDKTSPFSRSQKNPTLESYLTIIRKWQWIFRYLPFIEQVFLANSISFNATKQTSDIDLFIITKPKRLRTARLITSVLMQLLGIKRTSTNSVQKFCLSFFISSDKQSLQDLLLSEQDLYLPYRIAHLVPLYDQNEKQNPESVSSFWQSFYEQNLRVQNFLPDRTPQQHIFINLTTKQGRSRLKKFFEIFLIWKIWNFLEQQIINIRTPYIQKKIDKNPDLHRSVIFTIQMLKFHHDKRAEISQKLYDSK